MQKREKHTDSPWDVSLVEQIKVAVKARVDLKSKDSKPKARLNFILGEIHRLSDTQVSRERLELVVLIVTALLHHSRHKGLNEKTIRDLKEMAESVLLLNRVRPCSSKLSFLYGELHLALSKIEFNSGNVWKSAWEQQVAYYLSQRAPVGGKGLQQLSMAIRSLRLGNSAVAIQCLEKLDPKDLSRDSAIHAEIEYVRALRLNGQFALAGEKAEGFAQRVGITNEEKLEFDWQILCAKVSANGDIEPMMEAIRPSGSHHSYDYLFEAFLWTRVVKSRNWLTRYPKVHTMAHRLGPIAGNPNPLYKIAQLLEQCYDFALPKTTRLNLLEELIELGKALPTVDLELLVWGSACRLLARFRADDLATLVYAQYQNKCLSLTNGKSTDCLGLLSDVEEREALHEEFEEAS